MYIDDHAHIGAWGEWDCPLETLLDRMNRHDIAYAIVSNMDCNAAATAQEELAYNRDALRLIAPYRDRLRVLYWWRPDMVASDADIETLFGEGGCVGFKIHPRVGGLSLADPAWDRCFSLAQRLGVPVCAHTEADGICESSYLADAACRYPGAVFIAVHADFRSDHARAFEAARDIANFYVDTALVSAQDTLCAVAVCGARKVLFGSDAPAVSEEYCSRYDGLYEAIQDRFGTDSADDVCWRNVCRLYGWPAITDREETPNGR